MCHIDADNHGFTLGDNAEFRGIHTLIPATKLQIDLERYICKKYVVLPSMSKVATHNADILNPPFEIAIDFDAVVHRVPVAAKDHKQK
jgi:hypothetical protein